MEEIIKWCNENNGFLTGLLSLLTVIVSIIAIVVSIKTARMPYKKSIVLTSTTNFLIGQNNFSGQVVSQFSGVSINAANVGNRNIKGGKYTTRENDICMSRQPLGSRWKIKYTITARGNTSWLRAEQI